MKKINFIGLVTDKVNKKKLLEILIVIMVGLGIFLLLTITLN